MYFVASNWSGGCDAKPHTRYELVRLLSICVLILCFYFINANGKVILFLLITFVIFLANCVALIRLMPYYNMTFNMFRQGSIVTVTSAIFCCIISEFFNATNQTSSSISILFYFLTPCLVELNHLMRIRKVKSILSTEVSDLKSYY